MSLPVQFLFLIPLLPLLAAGMISVARQPNRRFAATLAIGAMAVAFLLSCAAFAGTLGRIRRFAHLHLQRRVHGP
jgi:NADH-quinone oxidoreductase subunit L